MVTRCYQTWIHTWKKHWDLQLCLFLVFVLLGELPQGTFWEQETVWCSYLDLTFMNGYIFTILYNSHIVETFLGHNFKRFTKKCLVTFSKLSYIKYQIYQWRLYHTDIYTPDVSGQVPCMRPNMFPQALDTAAIFASTGRLWMTNETSLRCCFANVCAWPRMPNPVMSVAAWALNVCMRLAAARENKKLT